MANAFIQPTNDLNAFVPSQSTAQMLAPQTGTMYDPIIQVLGGISQQNRERAAFDAKKQAEADKLAALEQFNVANAEKSGFGADYGKVAAQAGQLVAPPKIVKPKDPKDLSKVSTDFTLEGNPVTVLIDRKGNPQTFNQQTRQWEFNPNVVPSKPVEDRQLAMTKRADARAERSAISKTIPSPAKYQKAKGNLGHYEAAKKLLEDMRKGLDPTDTGLVGAGKRLLEGVTNTFSPEMMSDELIKRQNKADLLVATLAKALVGGGARSDRDMAYVKSLISPTSFGGSVESVNARWDELENFINASMSEDAGTVQARDEGLARLKNVGKEPVRVSTVEEAMKLNKGTIFIDPDGVERIR